MSESPKSTSSTQNAASESTKTESKADTTASTDSTAATTTKNETGKSSREAVGGSGAVHYGFFSNVKTPQYRSGWDDIWSKKSNKKKPARAQVKEPVIIRLALDELPAELQESFAEVARTRLKRSRINYDNRVKADAVTWRIECEVKR